MKGYDIFKEGFEEWNLKKIVESDITTDGKRLNLTDAEIKLINESLEDEF